MLHYPKRYGGKDMSYHKTVEQYLEYCKFRKELDWNTLKAYRIDLKQFFEYVREEIPEKATVEAYITELHKKYKPKTIKRKIASVRTYYSYLEENEIIQSNPFRKIKVKFKEISLLPRIIPREEIEKLLNYMYINENRKSEKAYKFWLRDVAMIEIFFATGARVYEISNIKAECVNLNSGLIKIMGKGGKERYIQVVTPEILEILKKYYMYNCKEIKKSGFFFINSRGTRYYPIRIYVT
jgi:integrase/recombinase XerD